MSGRVGVFRRGWVNLSADFRGKRATPTNHCWYQSSTVIALSCGIKISVVRHLVLSQSTRVTDRRTDGQTELRLPRPPSHNGGLDQYGAGPFEQQQFGTAGIEGVNNDTIDTRKQKIETNR